MGISRDGMHKRSHTSAKRAQIRKKRKFELGRQPSNTKIGEKRIHLVRARGGNMKYRALRLNSGNFSWASESITKKVKIIRVVYNATSNELVRTNTLVKGAIVEIDFTPYRTWYETHYGKKFPSLKSEEKAPLAKKQSGSGGIGKGSAENKEKSTVAPVSSEKPTTVDPSILDENFIKSTTGSKVLARISSRPGQCGRADGYILEGKELEFYLRRLRAKK